MKTSQSSTVPTICLRVTSADRAARVEPPSGSSSTTTGPSCFAGRSGSSRPMRRSVP